MAQHTKPSYPFHKKGDEIGIADAQLQITFTAMVQKVRRPEYAHLHKARKMYLCELWSWQELCKYLSRNLDIAEY